jgi:hypothetical protein
MCNPKTPQEDAAEAALVNATLTDAKWQILDRFIGETFQDATYTLRTLKHFE